MRNNKIDELLEKANPLDRMYATQALKLIRMSKSASEEAASWAEGISDPELKEAVEEEEE